MGENIYNTKADKRYRNLGIILTLIMLCCFVLIIIAFIMGYEWVKSQKDIVTSFSQLGLNSIIISLVLYSCAIIFLGSPKYTFFPMINSIKIKLLGFLFMYYFGVFLQTLAYFIFGLPIAFLLIETTGLTESDLFVILMFTLCILFILDILIKLPYQIEKVFNWLMQKLLKGQNSQILEPEIELKKIYNLEKLYSIIATITTILVIGEAAGTIAFPLVVPEGSNNYQVYLDSKSYIYMLAFVSATLVYLKELISGGIKKETTENN